MRCQQLVNLEELRQSIETINEATDTVEKFKKCMLAVVAFTRVQCNALSGKQYADACESTHNHGDMARQRKLVADQEAACNSFLEILDAELATLTDDQLVRGTLSRVFFWIHCRSISFACSPNEACPLSHALICDVLTILCADAVRRAVGRMRSMRSQSVNVRFKQVAGRRSGVHGATLRPP